MSDTPPQPKPEPQTPANQPTQPDTPSNSEPTAPTAPSNQSNPDNPSNQSNQSNQSNPNNQSNQSNPNNPEPSTPEPSTPATPTAPPQAPGQPPAPPMPPASPTPPAANGQPNSQPPAQNTPKAEKRSGNVGVIAALAIAALVGGVSGAGVYAIATNNGDSSNATVTPSETNITVNDPSNATTITAVAAQAAESVVTISVRGEGASGSGSGVFLSEDGYILTNAHVATLSGATADPAVQVRTSDGHLHDATLVGSDPIADLAVVKVEANGVEFKPAEFADSSHLNVGDTVVALGAPLGLPNTVTSGIVSALNRSITVASSAVPDTEDSPLPPENDGNDGNGPFDFWEFDSEDDDNRPAPSATIALPVIQTDAAINPGNSGGALLDSDGNVIGINVAIASAGGSREMAGNIGLGFAIPSNLAQRVAEELIEDGTASHGLLGASVLSVTDDQEASQSSTVVGSVIKEVTPGGAADEAGIRPGDIVIEFNGMPITSSTDLTAQVRVLPGGADAELVYVRDGQTETVTVTLGEL